MVRYPYSGNDDVAMNSMSRSAARSGVGTKELYDAFGEVSDDGEFLDEGAGLGRPLTESYHEGFLDDNDESPILCTKII